ncbi:MULTISPECIES: MFS transporter [unclassified Oleiphilus]|uniref:MFS transporter n=2 Tax=Oleiphilus TaxID=141450 RepID=UPI000839419E|nr:MULTISPECIES: MFS transporter [unclassified Oleiphilus]
MPVASLAVLFALYFSQGLPSGVLAHAFPAIMRDQGVSLEYIGLIKLLALPWALKFIWAPYVDRIGWARIGVHRTWIVAMQLLLVGLLLLASMSNYESLFGPLIVIFLIGILLVNTSAATQDIATDGLAVKVLAERFRGIGNSVQVTGFKLGMILSGSGLLLGIDHFGWSLSMQLMALLLVLLMLPIFTGAIPVYPKVTNNFDAGVADKGMARALPLTVYKGFFKRSNMLAWVLVLITYKLADSLGSVMIKPLLIDSGFSLGDLATITLWSSIAGLLGAALGGYLYLRLGAKNMMLIAGLAQAVGIALYTLVDLHWVGILGVYGLSIFEQAVDGMSTVALFSLMMAQCRSGHEGADFTVQASIQVLVSGLAAALGGLLAGMLGYFSTFVVAGAVGLVSLVFVLHYFRQK